MPEPKLGTNRKPPNGGKGRPKGAKNKTSLAAKEAIALVFDKLGGAPALHTWASLSDDNTKVFYTAIWPKIIALSIEGQGEGGEHIHEIIFRIGNGRAGS